MSDLQNLTPANTYKALLQIGDYTDGISGDTGANALQVSDGAGNNTSLALSTDRVGIGTTSPDGELHINDASGASQIYATSADASSTGLYLGDQSRNFRGGIIYNNSNDSLQLWGFDTSAQTAQRMTIDSSGNVGIGTTSPTSKVTVSETDGATLTLRRNSSAGVLDDLIGKIDFYNNDTSVPGARITATIGAYVKETAGGTYLVLNTAPNGGSNTERMRIDSSGNVGIGTTSPGGKLEVRRDSNSTSTNANSSNDDTLSLVNLNDTTSNHTSIAFVGANNEVTGRICSVTDAGNGRGSLDFIYGSAIDGSKNLGMRITSDGNVLPGTDDAQDLGSASKRWDVIYVKDSNITTSDRQLKQDIEELTEAETRVAQACKGLLRKYRWKDAVAQKGDEARIHFGIIAQDLEDAFNAEGLDAGRYGMFVKNTWWTADRVIPAVEAVEAVEAVYDEEGNEVSPAVEAVEAQPEETVTDIFVNSEDAPEGATEVTQRGVRYSELLAFIISAI